MANQLPVIILTVFTILLLIEMSNSLPYHRDIDAGQSDCRTVPHVIVINSTTGAIKNCRICPGCPYGHGLNIPCHGQNVTESQNIECVPCVSGVNYSTGETNQCKPCLPRKCKAGERIVGKCEDDGDRRRCKRCELKDWYYNETQMTCLPCACENMTSEIQEICKEIGFKGDACKTDGPNTTLHTTPKAPESLENESEVWNTKYTIIVASLIVFILFVLYVYCVRSRAKELKLEHPQLSVCSKDWFCQIFFFKKTTSSRPTLTIELAPSLNSPERAPFIRQFSCPVTQNEIYAVISTPHAAPPDDNEITGLLNQECEQQKLKFIQMNAETCRIILQKLEDPDLVDTDMGYTSLAGRMGFSHEKVKEFKASGNPCRSMLEAWSSSEENNVLKLKRMLEEMKRDDIVKLLKVELEKVKKDCHCRECAA